MKEGSLKLEAVGIRHPKLGNDMLRWDEILYVDYIETQGGKRAPANIVLFTMTPQAISRLNQVLPFYKRMLFPAIFGEKLMVDVTYEPLLDATSEFTAGVQIFDATAKHVPIRERVAKSGIENFADEQIIAHSLTTAIDTPRPPRGLKDGAALFLLAICVFAALMALIIVPFYHFANVNS